MLSYFNTGQRDYARHPIRTGRARRLWEFQAVLNGRIGRAESDGSHTALCDSTLWLAPPESLHGWIGAGGEVAEVVVFHFRHVPEVLKQRMEGDDHIALTLSDSGRERIRFLSKQVERYWQQPSSGMLLCFEAVLSELSLLVYEADSEVRGVEPSNVRRKVSRTLEIYEQHMADNPSVAEVAELAGISSAHLRRHFQRIFGRPPKALFDELRERRILELLTDSDCSLAEIAEQTGFSESSALSRAFKLRFGCPPSHMRRR